jgi:glyoxylase I family protein
MYVEHMGICVGHPFEMADWYVRNFDFEILKKSGTKDDGVVFIGDGKGNTVLELYNAPGTGKINFSSLTPLQFHIAIEVESPYEKSLELEKAGAKIEGKPVSDNDWKYMVRDPWGLTLQILNRQPKLK